jgi:hypothetical protein
MTKYVSKDFPDFPRPAYLWVHHFTPRSLSFMILKRRADHVEQLVRVL